jgi:UDP-N-acetylglucosamine--N-acetylmuramyl-(pentapeptide) pyrophosphoryl-undecaprenol N-acetylglucosamine transferase
VVVIGVKYGRYHNLASVFEGAVLESHVDNISEVVNQAFDQYDSMKEATRKYSGEVIDAPHELCEFVKKYMKK